MIGLLTGILLDKQPPSLMLLVSGIGYEIEAPMSTFYVLPELQQTVTLWTHLSIREDAHQLYGFYTQDERVLFRTLLKVNGVGPRLALTILSSASPAEFAHMVLNNDTGSLVRVPGIGKKTAERLVIEMRDKLSEHAFAKSNQSTGTLLPEPKNERQLVLHDAVSALVSLGYKHTDANRLVTKMDDGAASSQDLIRRSLREMMA
jgi:Holliday junction DNA helicase RuvA